MTDRTILRPPAELLGPSVSAEAHTLTAEVRSDASISFDPLAGPGYLLLKNVAFGAVIQWRVSVSWSQAQQIQGWLTALAATGIPNQTREAALKDFFENLQAGTPTPGPFLEYVGTYLTTGTSHASYTLVLGMHTPVARDAYQTAFNTALNALPAGPTSWSVQLISFLKMMLNQPSSREEFLSLAVNVGSLSAGPPLIQKLIGP